MNCLSKEELVDCLFSKDRAAGAAAEAHFSVCPACRARMETLRGLKAAAAAVPLPPVSADFTARLMRELKTEAPAGTAPVQTFSRPFFRPAWGFGLAAFAAAAYLGVFFLTGHRAPRAVPEEALLFSDGPATVNSEVLARGGEGFVYTDGCATARCGI